MRNPFKKKPPLPKATVPTFIEDTSKAPALWPTETAGTRSIIVEQPASRKKYINIRVLISERRKQLLAQGKRPMRAIASLGALRKLRARGIDVAISKQWRIQL